MTFGFKKLSEYAYYWLRETGVGVNFHRTAWTDNLSRVDVHAPEDTQVIVEDDKTMYYYLINGHVYQKTDGIRAEELYPTMEPDVLYCVPDERQAELKSRIETYYQNHRSFRERQF